VFKWPKRTEVDKAARIWASQLVQQKPEVIKLGYFGSYARGDWGVGSDLDLIAVVERSEKAFEMRSLDWDVSRLPVPAQILVYTVDEWKSLQQEGKRFASTLARETVWVHDKSQKGC
jgi:predicted nucleotidyltransferase